MPGNPFSTIWATNPAFTPDFTAEEIDSALSREGVASADLILCGHTPGPTLLRIALPNGRAALVVRGSGHLPGDGPGPRHQGICVLTDRGGPLTGFARWSIEFEWAPFEPRDPNWTEAKAHTAPRPLESAIRILAMRVATRPKVPENQWSRPRVLTP